MSCLLSRAGMLQLDDQHACRDRTITYSDGPSPLPGRIYPGRHSWSLARRPTMAGCHAKKTFLGSFVINNSRKLHHPLNTPASDWKHGTRLGILSTYALALVAHFPARQSSGGIGPHRIRSSQLYAPRLCSNGRFPTALPH